MLGVESENAALSGQCHQLTVDTYAMHHTGGDHPDTSIGVPLAGLHFLLQEDIPPPTVPSDPQRLAEAMWEAWSAHPDTVADLIQTHLTDGSSSDRR